jgi:uncharacterized secreted protein with C-terminal beta-propeller domain
MPTPTLARRSLPRKLILESLESRQLMATNIFDSNDLQPPVLLSITSEAQAVERLSEMAVKRYAELFGQPTPGIISWYHPQRPSIFPRESQAVLVSHDVTNNQQSGVDESDGFEISSDGYLFAVRGGTVFVMDTRDPTNLKEAGRYNLNVNGIQSSAINLIGDRLVVVSQVGPNAPNRNYSATVVSILDVSKRTTPKAVRSFEIEGYSLQSRIVDGKLILVQQEQGLPAPLLIASDSVNPLGNSHRYETKAEYLARIKPTIVSLMSPDFKELDASGQMVRRGDIGDFHDLAIVGFPDPIAPNQRSIVSIDVTAEIPKLLDSEEVISGYGQVTYVTGENVYLTSIDGSSQTTIIQIALDREKGDLVTEAVGSIGGTIQDSRFMDEYQGHLRVVATSNNWQMPWANEVEIHLFVLHSQDGKLNLVGSVNDIAPNERLYSAEFDGTRAWITTTHLTQDELMSIDPLHGIDLSDPTAPKVLSALVIPGITQHMQWVDTTHMVGIGVVQKNGRWHSMVSLYEVKDLSAPKLLDTWESDKPTFASIHTSISSLRIHYNSATKTLTIPLDPSFNWFGGWVFPVAIPLQTITDLPPGLPIRIPDFFPAPEFPKVAVFKIDVGAKDPLRSIGTVAYEGHSGQGVVVGNTLLVLSDTWLSTYATTNLTKRLDRIPFDVSATPVDPVDPVDPIDPDEKEVATVQLMLTATRDDGSAVSNIEQGDEFWINVQAKDMRKSPQGVYAAYFDVALDKSKFAIVGKAEPQGKFTNKVMGEVTDNGWHNLGGFSDSTSPLGAGPQSIVRFKIKALSNSKLEITVTPSSTEGLETLVYGVDDLIDKTDVLSATLVVSSKQVTNASPHFDVNQDGLESPLDSLIVINYLNRQDDSSAQSKSLAATQSNAFDLDVNGDGQVSLLDVLVIVNRLNDKTRTANTAQGEGEQSSSDLMFATAVDREFATAETWQQGPIWLDVDSERLKSRRG